MKKFIKKSLVAIMTAAMVVTSFGTTGTKVEAAPSGYKLQDKTVQNLMSEYGVIVFGNANVNAHLHSNFLVNHLSTDQASGLRTKYKVKEEFYFKTADRLSANISEYSESGTDVLYTASQVVKSGSENRVRLTTNELMKIDKPTTVISDTELQNQGTYSQYVDLTDVKNKFIAYNKALAGQGNKGIVEVSITGDQNKRYIKAGSGESYRNIPYADFAKYVSNQIHFDFSDCTNDNDTLIMNIDLAGQTEVFFPALIIRNNGEAILSSEANFESKYNRMYFNFYDSSKADKQYTGKITFSERGFGTIIAPSANVKVSSNWDGTIISNDLEVAAQFHRINGTGIPSVAVNEENSGTGSTETPGTGSTETPGTGSTETPGTESTETPGTGSTETPGTESTETPGTGSTETPSTGSLSVTVKDEKTDEPVPGATIEVTSPSGDKTEHVTDEEGSVTVDNVPEGDYTVVITDVPDGYTVTTGEEIEVSVEKGKSNSKTVTKNKEDAKNAKKALKKAADVKTGLDDSEQALVEQKSSVTQVGAKNNNKITKKYSKKLKNYKKKHKKQSKEIAAWITIGGTKIDYPVMYTGLKNNTKYLSKNINGEKDTHGMLFASYLTPKRTITYNSVIYGHNMKDGTMFTDLTKYASKSFYKKHKYVKLETQGYNYVYEVVEVIRVSCKKGSKDRMIYQKFADLDNKKTFKKWKKQVTKNREYKCSGKYNRSDNLLMLSTCEYEKENGRFALICKQVKCTKVKK